jgi:hypothetical protein
MRENVRQKKLENLKKKENLEYLGENEKTGHILDSSNSIGGQAELIIKKTIN